MHIQNFLKTAAALGLALASVALATPPSHNGLGATFTIVSKGETSIIEIRLKPRSSFDTVRVEPASGVGSLTPPCSFSAVVVGGSYVCRVSVSHKAGEASLTLNVVGEKATDPQKPRVVEISHFTLANGAFTATAVPRSNRPAPGLLLTPPQDMPK